MIFHPRFWATLTLLLSACSQAPERARHTVEAYRADRALRDTTLKACANDLGTLGKTPDCVNAQSAAALDGAGRLRTLPPLKLDPSSNPMSSHGNPPEPHSHQEP